VNNRPASLSTVAPAKINLFLHAGEKRADGFHELLSLAVFTEAGDELRFDPCDDLTLEIAGPFSAGLSNGEDNLILRAARALSAETGIRRGAAIRLQKNLPVASGIGGGSSDAAAALRGLARLWNIDISEAELHSLAAGLGSDVPVCLSGRPAWMSGRGERLLDAPPLPGMWLVLVNPRVAVPTGAVFAGLTARCGTKLLLPASFGDLPGLIGFLASTGNDLEAPACEIAPVIREVLTSLKTAPGVLLSRMSGSGATCFAIFDRRTAARELVAHLRQRTDWWVCETALGPPRQ
jgi:4-diphosphocytidyl-2-C-methyl-D-erythritol kinase